MDSSLRSHTSEMRDVYLEDNVMPTEPLPRGFSARNANVFPLTSGTAILAA